MAATRTPGGDGRHRAVAAILFLCLFAAQAGAVTLSPVLAQIAGDLGVSTAAAGQLRTVAGLVAGATALGLNGMGRRVGLGRQLLCGAILLAVGSLGSAAAPGIGLLAAAQIPVGAGIGILTTAGALAAAEWVPDGRRAAVLSWALIGQPAAWIAGMPLVGAAAGWSWRAAWLVFPLASAVAAEALTNTGWAGILVYAGALLAQTYGVSSEEAGVALASGAGAYVCGNLAVRRLADRDPRPLLVALAVALGAAVALFGAFRPSPIVSTVLFAAAAFAAGARTFLASAFALAAPPELRTGATAMRAATMQFGYFTGSLAAGAALALGGYAALGAAMGALFVSAALVLGGSHADGEDVAATAGRPVAVGGSE